MDEETRTIDKDTVTSAEEGWAALKRQIASGDLAEIRSAAETFDHEFGQFLQPVREYVEAKGELVLAGHTAG